MQLFTYRYQEFQPSMGVPVRITVGYPRFPLWYDLRFSVMMLAPDSAFLRASRTVFEQRYEAQLIDIGVDRIRREFETIARVAEDDRLVLLCYEDLSKPGLWCHRTLFAEWWTGQTGEPITETAPPYEQGTLL